LRAASAARAACRYAFPSEKCAISFSGSAAAMCSKRAIRSLRSVIVLLPQGFDSAIMGGPNQIIHVPTCMIRILGCDQTLMADLSVQLAGLSLRNPLIAASGTCGYVDELSDVMKPDWLGAMVTKSITVE